jgi:hypothetical protein
MVSTVGKVPTAQEMFLALFIFDPDNVVARGAMTAVNAFNNSMLLRKLCTQMVLERHRDRDPEIYGDPANSLNRVPRRDGEGYMTPMERPAFYSEQAEHGTVSIPPGKVDKISWGQRTGANAELRKKCELKRLALVAQLTEATQALRPLVADTVGFMRTQSF